MDSMKLHNDLRKEFIGEAIGDNVVDNLLKNMQLATETEVGLFVAGMLSANVEAFAYVFESPMYEGFKECFNKIVMRWSVMDEIERGDVVAKLLLMFRDLFMKKYSAVGPEAVDLIARRYTDLMVEEIKARSVSHTNFVQPKAWDKVY